MKKIITCTLMLMTLAVSAQIGHKTITFADPARTGGFGSGGGSGRQIQCEIYYPAATTGDNVPIVGSNYPVIVFGHGFVMSWDAYQNIWEDLVPEGYIVAFPRTEGSISPSHSEFGLDLAFVASKMQINSINDPAFFFYQKVAPTSAIMGHSMGGGATYLAAANNTDITCIATLAAAETNPSAVSAAANIKVPVLSIAGGNDCVAAPSGHQIPIYNGCGSKCKTLVTITGASHCQFAESNFNCNFGEATCTPAPAISRATQHTYQAGFYKRFLKKYLYGTCAPNSDFDAYLPTTSSIATHQQSCISQAGNNSAGCAGIATQLGSTIMDGYNFSWTSIPSGFTSTNPTPTVNTQVTTTYILTYTNLQSNCIVIDSVTRTILAVANAGPDVSTCQQTAIQIGTPAVGNSTYSWASIPAGFSATAAQPNVQPTATTTYIVTATNGGCNDVDTTVVQVGIPSEPIISTQNNSTAFCEGDSLLLTSNLNSNFIWLPGMQTTTGIYASDSGTYALVSGYGSACSDTAYITVSMNLKPHITVVGDFLICPGDSMILTGAAGYESYLWYPFGETTQDVWAYYGGPSYYSEIGVDTNGCQGVVAEYSVDDHPANFTTIMQQGDSLYLNPAPPNWTYQWYYNGVPIDNETASGINPTNDGQYYVMVVDNHFCGFATGEYTYIHESILNLENLSISIYPNPANDILYINLTNTGVSTLNLIDYNGRLVRSEKAANTLTELDLKGLTGGLYLLQVIDNTGNHTYKVIKE